jgi:hypothetical protein
VTLRFDWPLEAGAIVEVVLRQAVNN